MVTSLREDINRGIFQYVEIFVLETERVALLYYQQIFTCHKGNVIDMFCIVFTLMSEGECVSECVSECM